MKEYKTNIKIIRAGLSQDVELCVKAMEIIHAYQVREEYDSGSVLYRNNVGFTPADSDFLTSLCNYRKNHHGHLTDKQLVYCKKLMPKYARQLFDHFISHGKITAARSDSRYIVHYSNLWEAFDETVINSSPVQAELPFDEDTSSDRAYEQEAWRETMADDVNYFNAERFFDEMINL